CTAYPRFVVQRSMFADFLQAYLPVVESLRFGNPLAVESEDLPFPELDFGPVISAAKATELRQNFDDAVRGGGIPIVHRTLRDGKFLPHQDTSAYVAPACVLQPPTSWALHHSEPFGPLDSIVIVDTEAEFLAAMNASNGSLVGSIATDDHEFAHRVGDELQSFKIGINAPRSRGDRDEIFGGKGASWKGAFVGGDLLVQAVTVPADGSDETLYGNFPSYSLYPPSSGLVVPA
ncbi:MAG: aldehyde dehydrogenase family protein, partial [Candidatus Nanopelagicales bacterium]